MIRRPNGWTTISVPAKSKNAPAVRFWVKADRPRTGRAESVIRGTPDAASTIDAPKHPAK